MQGKLASKDRLLKWSMVDNATCVLCSNGALESHNHLFFDCPYSSVVWRVISGKNHIHRCPLNWEDEKKWFLLHSKGKTIKKSILKLSLAATVWYLVRKEYENLSTIDEGGYCIGLQDL